MPHTNDAHWGNPVGAEFAPLLTSACVLVALCVPCSLGQASLSLWRLVQCNMLPLGYATMAPRLQAVPPMPGTSAMGCPASHYVCWLCGGSNGSHRSGTVHGEQVGWACRRGATTRHSYVTDVDCCPVPIGRSHDNAPCLRGVAPGCLSPLASCQCLAGKALLGLLRPKA